MKHFRLLLSSLCLLLWVSGAWAQAVSENFDGVTPPATPTTINYIASWVTAAGGFTGNYITPSANVSSSLISKLVDTNSGNAVTQVYFYLTNTGAAVDAYVRMSNADPSLGNNYVARVYTGSGGGLYIKYNVAATPTTLAGPIGTESSFLLNTWYCLTMTANGTAISTTIQQKSGTNNGFWLNSGGTFVSGASTAYSGTDNHVTGAGYGAATVLIGGNLARLDNFSFGNYGAAATSYTFTGPTSGLVSAASTNFTLTPNAALSGADTVNLSDGGAGGTFTPSSLSFLSGATTGQTFTYTPSATPGSRVLTPTSATLGLSFSPTTIIYVSSAAGATFSAKTGGVVWPPGVIYWDGSNYGHLISNDLNGYADFTGTSFALKCSLAKYRAAGLATSAWPIFFVSVDGGAVAKITLSDPGVDVQTITLASSLTSGTHHIVFRHCIQDEGGLYGLVSQRDDLTVQSVILDAGATLSAPTSAATAPTNLVMLFGDSIAQGAYSNGGSGFTVGSIPYNFLSFANVLAMSLNANLGKVAYSGQGWTNTYSSDAPTLPTAFANYYNGLARTFPTAGTGQNIVFFCEGQNDPDATNITSTVQTFISAARTAYGANWWLFFVAPFNDRHQAEIAAAVAAYKSAHPSDTKVGFIRPANSMHSIVGTTNVQDFYTLEGVHPLPYAHPLYGGVLANEAQKIISAGTSSTVTNNKGSHQTGKGGH